MHRLITGIITSLHYPGMLILTCRGGIHLSSMRRLPSFKYRAGSLRAFELNCCIITHAQGLIIGTTIAVPPGS